MKSNKKTVYLAGGFKSGWQNKVKEVLSGWEIFDPSLHFLESPADYTKWDLEAVQKSCFILAYLEKDNPGGYALALEIGYAKALGKTILFVEEHPGKVRRKYFDMIREVSDYTYDSLNQAIDFLKQK